MRIRPATGANSGAMASQVSGTGGVAASSISKDYPMTSKSKLKIADLALSRVALRV